MTSTNDTNSDDGESPCWACAGLGYHEGECSCGEDTCCCLEPDVPACEECGGDGVPRGRAA